MSSRFDLDRDGNSETFAILLGWNHTRASVNIGGHGFWDKGGVYTLGVSEKNSVAASVGVHRGVNFRKKLEF